MFSWLKRKAIGYVFGNYLTVDNVANELAAVANRILCKVPEKRAENVESVCECANIIAAAAKDRNVTNTEMIGILNAVIHRFTEFGGVEEALKGLRSAIEAKV